MNCSNLKIDWASHAAAKYACENWHYSKRLPMPPIVMVGAWENNKYIGCVLFGRGANCSIGKEYGLNMTTCCELVRIALASHSTPVSRIVRIAIMFLKKSNPLLRLVISYADSEQGHHGGIYQAGNWIYVGRGMGSIEFFHDGRWKHNREVTAGAFGGRKMYNASKLQKRKTLGKHKYLMPLDAEISKSISQLAKPYPKRKKQTHAGEASNDAPPFQGGEDGEAPIRRLQLDAGAPTAERPLV